MNMKTNFVFALDQTFQQALPGLQTTGK